MKKELFIMIALLVVAMFVVSACSSGEAFRKASKEKSISQPCIDTDEIKDNGVNPFVFGQVKGDFGKFEDECDGEVFLKEYYCYNNDAKAQSINCQELGYELGKDYICENGACVSIPTCDDSDGGFNYYIQGTCTDFAGNSMTDSCNGDILTEFLCSNQNTCVESHNSPFVCPSGCIDSACVESDTTPPILTSTWTELDNGYTVDVLAYDESGLSSIGGTMYGPITGSGSGHPCNNLSNCSLSFPDLNGGTGWYSFVVHAYDIYGNEAVLNESMYFNGAGTLENITITSDDTNNWYNEDSELVFADGDLILRFRASDNVFLVNGNSYKEVIFGANKENVGLVLANGDRLNTSFVDSIGIQVNNGDIFYVDIDPDSIGNLSSIIFKDIGINYGINPDATYSIDDLSWFIDWEEDDVLGSDVVYLDKNVGTRDEDFTTDFGVIVYNLKSSLEDELGSILMTYPENIIMNDLTPPTLTATWTELDNGYAVDVLAYDESGLSSIGGTMYGPIIVGGSAHPCNNFLNCSLSLSNNGGKGWYSIVVSSIDIYGNEAFLNESMYFYGVAGTLGNITITSDDINNWYNEDSELVFADGEFALRFIASDDVFLVNGNSYKEVIFDIDKENVGLVLANGDRLNTSFVDSIGIQVNNGDIFYVDIDPDSVGNLSGVIFKDIGIHYETNPDATYAIDDLYWFIDWEDDVALGSDVVYLGKNIGTRDEDFTTDFGVIVYTLESSLEDDLGSIYMSYPKNIN